MFFISITVDLESKQCPPASYLQLSVFAHAAVMNLISSIDSALGRRFHDCARNKPMSLAVVSLKSQRITLRVSFMGQHGMQAANALALALTQTDHLTLGHNRWQIAGFHCSGHPWAATSTWTDLTEPCSARWIEFSFASPTAFSKNDGRNSRFVSVLPEPLDVFSSLLQRWNGLEGPPMPSNLASYVQRGGCRVSDVEIRCITTQLQERTQKGFVGRVTYEVSDKEPACAIAIHQLGRLAFFSGVGYQTARGMGAVRTHSR